MNKYSFLVGALLANAALGCGAETSSSDSEPLDDVDTYLAALEDEVTEDIADDVLSENFVEAEDEEGFEEGDGRERPDSWGECVRRRREHRGVGHRGGNGIADLILLYGDLEALQACQDAYSVCEEEFPVCAMEARECLVPVREQAFATMCEEQLAVCDEVEEDTDGRGVCQRVESVCVPFLEGEEGEDDEGEDDEAEEAEESADADTEESDEADEDETSDEERPFRRGDREGRDGDGEQADGDAGEAGAEDEVDADASDESEEDTEEA